MEIGLLEDDPAQANMVRDWLLESGYDVFWAATGGELIQQLRERPFDCLVLDWELPDTTGFEVLQFVRQSLGLQIPVLFATQRDDESEIIAALEAGADDYLVKPLRKGEALARIKAMLRRTGVTSGAQTLELGPIVLDLVERRALVDGEEVALSNKDFELASFVMANQGKVLSRAYLLKMVWGVSEDLSTRTVDVHISRMRRKLGIGPAMGYALKTIYQHGYRLEKLQ